MVSERYFYLLPLMIACLCLIRYMFCSNTRYRLKSFQQRNKDRFIYYTTKVAAKMLPKGSKLYIFYVDKILNHSKLSIEKLLLIKFYLFMTVLLIMILVKITNIAIVTEEIFGVFDYKVDLIYEYKNKVIDIGQAMEQEITYLNIALKEISKYEIWQQSAENVQLKIKNLIHQSDEFLLQPKDTIANKVYHRMLQYYQAKEWQIYMYLLTGFAVSFVPEVYLMLRKIFIRADAKRELAFLKQLIVLNGSIKPVDFTMVLKILIEKAKYYKPILQEIEDKNRRNSMDNKMIYSEYIRHCKDVDSKLFFEKLDQANNYDFDQAIINIENEFRIQRREEIRKVRKQIELIHITGVVGFMLIIAVMVIYLIAPWMHQYDMNKILV